MSNDNNTVGSIRILYVDDDSSMLNIAKVLLAELAPDISVDTAFNVAEAFEKLANNEYDIILSDYEMPEKNGLDFLKELKQKRVNIPFILFTGKGREEVAIEALNTGAKGYINKQGAPETVYGELIHSIKTAHHHKQAEDALKESNERFRVMADGAPTLIWVTDKDGSHVSVNKAYLKFFQATEEQVSGKKWHPLIHPDDQPEYLGKMMEAIRGQTPFHAQARVNAANLGWRWIETSATPRFSGNGEYIGHIGISIDITSRKDAEKALTESERKYRSLFSSMSEGVCLHEMVYDESGKPRDYRILDANSAYENLTGIKYTDAIGKLGSQLYGVSEAPYLAEYASVTEGGQNLYFTTYFSPMKKYFRISVFSPQKGKFATVFSDITEQKSHEIKLRQINAQLETVGENIDAGLAIIDRNYNVVWANRRLRSLGVDDNKKCHHVLAKSDVVCPNCGVKKIFEEGSILDVHDYKTVNAQGETTFVEIRVTPIKDEFGNVVNALELAIPITKRKTAEDALRESQARYQNMIEVTSDFIWEMDTEGRYTYCSPQSERLWGYKPEQLIGKTPFDMMPIDQKNAGLSYFQKVISMLEPFHDLETLAYNAIGEPIIIETSGVPIFNKKGEWVGYRGISRDITARKNAEQEILKSKQKMEIINQKLHFVGGITRHDVRNRLSAIRANTYLLKKRLAEDPELTYYLSKIESDVASADRLFELSSLFERIGIEEPTQINVKACFDNALAMFYDLSGIKITNSADGLIVKADSLLQQVFYNLVDNSMKHGQKVTEIKLHYEKKDNETLLIYEDNGVGIALENKEKIFSEGFSTGNSSGLGLSILKRIVQVYGWVISETGEFGRGVKFLVAIPDT